MPSKKLKAAPPPLDAETLDVVPEAAPPPEPLNPLDRIPDGGPIPRGMPVTSGGHTWFLALPGLDASLDQLRDKIFDSIQLRRDHVNMGDVFEVAWFLIRANYQLDPVEAATIIHATAPAELAQAVVSALFEPGKVGLRTYTEWAVSAFAANGVDPSTVPPERIPDVLEHWVGCGRCLGQARFVSSVDAKIQRAALGRR